MAVPAPRAGRRTAWRTPALAAILPGLAFALLAWAVAARHGAPFGPDLAGHRWAERHRPPAAVTAVRLLTGTGTGPFPYLAVAAGGWWAGRRPAAPGAALPMAGACVAALAVGQSLRSGVVAAMARPRPDVADWATRASGFAFPSGHAATSAMAAGLLAWGLLRAFRRPAARWAAGLCGCWAAAVGASRVYLGVHWPSDVLGGWLLAACWLGLVLPLLSLLAGRFVAKGSSTDL